MTDEKIYVFSYGTIQDPQFYEPLFGKEVKKYPASLNGFIKCKDQTNYFLLKKDTYGVVDGTVFEITKDQLFLIDRWEMFPQYGRFFANVFLKDKNEILENVYVYSKLEVGKWEKVTDSQVFSSDPKANQENLSAFVELEKQIADLPLYDFLFLYKSDKKTNEMIKQLTHPYAALFINWTTKNNEKYSLTSHGIFIELEYENEYYVGYLMFGRKEPNNAIHYSMMFNHELNELQHIDIGYKYLVQPFDLAIFNKQKPAFFLSAREDQNLEEKFKLGIYENCLELICQDFDLDPWKRLNLMLDAFFKHKKDIETTND
ncbi:gamma-glutamylcyclotransferase family protein [[Mycoplasma] anseris]|uniref:Gamma-glutamylcyclotransferase n=1 Tax=[Mycoplasma] anseris TaxID=92400 RepID=A0A2Z4NDG6_9BACT|nr:gamma-glutamylcyclotransferase family protein [[Mycoplasma] anseris]AWX69589.1 gamma-glutamylcyclotransferase [[Mycoplasma] anseris]